MSELTDIQFETLRAVAELGRPHVYRVKHAVGRKTSSVYAAVSALQAKGFLRAQWEKDAPPERPPRKLIELTAPGEQVLIREQALRAKRRGRAVLQPEGGLS